MAIPDLHQAISRCSNSTNGHAIKLPIPAFIRLPFRLASGISPKLGGELGRVIFFSPPRPRYTEAQRAILRQGRAGTVGSMGLKLATYSWGEGPSVLLVHGWGGHAGHLAELIGPITEAGFRAVAIDLPAHGQSEGRLSSLVHFGNAINAAAHRFGPFHGVIAHSLGAAGLIRAFLGGLAADRVVLLAPPAQFNDYWRFFRNGLGMSDAVWREMVKTSERWLGIPFTEVHPIAGAPKMTAPLLILHGVKDRVCPIGEGRALARLWPGARMLELETGHLSILKDERAIRAASLFIRT